MNEMLLDSKQLEKRFGVCRQTIWRWVREGKMPPAIRFSRRTMRWRAEDIEAFERAKSGYKRAN